MWRLFQLVFWVIPPVLLAGAGALFLWYKKDIYQKDQKLGVELKALRTAPTESYDFGLEKFDRAVALLREGKEDECRTALFSMLRYYGDSARAGDAMRLLGQLHMDRLFAPEANFPGKIRAEVARGDSINKIAADNQSTFHYILRTNGLTRPEGIQPNDRLWVCPLNFNVRIEARQKRIILLDGERFFALLPVQEIRRPPGARIPSKESVGNKFGIREGKRVQLAEDSQVSEKWIEIGNEWAIRSVPPGGTPGPGLGIFLASHDVDDLIAILRQGNSVEILP